MCYPAHICCSLWIRSSLPHIVPNYGPREILQTSPRHDHERPSLPPQIRSSQVSRRVHGDRRHHHVHGLLE